MITQYPLGGSNTQDEAVEVVIDNLQRRERDGYKPGDIEPLICRPDSWSWSSRNSFIFFTAPYKASGQKVRPVRFFASSNYPSSHPNTALLTNTGVMLNILSSGKRAK